MTEYDEYPTGICSDLECKFHYPERMVGRLGRLKCLQTVISKEPFDGLNFMIIKEKTNTYLITCCSVPNLAMEVKKSHFFII